MSHTFYQKYDLKHLKPVMENEVYAVYQLGYINDNLAKGVRVNKNTGEQLDVQIQLYPRLQIVSIIRDNAIQKIK